MRSSPALLHKLTVEPQASDTVALEVRQLNKLAAAEKTAWVVAIEERDVRFFSGPLPDPTGGKPVLLIAGSEVGLASTSDEPGAGDVRVQVDTVTINFPEARVLETNLYVD